MHRPTERADHACSDARLKAERISNRYHELTYAQILRVGQADMNKLRRIDSNHSEIRVRIVARHLGWIFASIRQIYRDRIRRMNDVAISQNESVRGDDETRPIAAQFAGSALDVDALFDVNVYHGRGDTRGRTDHGTRICIKQYGIVLASGGSVDVLARRRWSTRAHLV